VLKEDLDGLHDCGFNIVDLGLTILEDACPSFALYLQGDVVEKLNEATFKLDGRLGLKFLVYLRALVQDLERQINADQHLQDRDHIKLDVA
jgi:hypothetical protein